MRASRLQTVLVVLAIVVQLGARLRRLGEVGVFAQTLLTSLLLQLDAGIDQVEALLNLLGHRGGSRDVVADRMETVLVGGVLHVDQLAVGGDIRVLAVLDEHAVGMLGVDVLDEAGLRLVDVVAGLERVLVAAVLSCSLLYSRIGMKVVVFGSSSM